MPTIRIADRVVGDDHPTYVIAEAGINHQGDKEIAKQLIDVAAQAGADAVKFQKRTTNKILTREGLDAPYENPNSFGKTYGEHRDALELSGDVYHELKDYSDGKGIHFLASGWDSGSIDFLVELGVPALKLASADLTNLPLLKHAADKGLPLILSTGMATFEEVKKSVEFVRSTGVPFAVMQCTSTYPSQFPEINLRVIPMYMKEFGCVVGYSGHELGIAVSAASVAIGARIIERHFTLDRTMKGGDHAASLEPQGLQKLIRDIRAVETSLGDGVKQCYDSELPVRKKLAKSVVSETTIPAGTILEPKHLTTKSPGTGISAALLESCYGRRVKVDIPEDVVINEDMLE